MFSRAFDADLLRGRLSPTRLVSLVRALAWIGMHRHPRPPTTPERLRRVIHVSPGWFDDEAYVGGGERYPLGLAEAMAELVPTTFVSFGPRRQSLQRGKLGVEIYRAARYVDDVRWDPISFAYLPTLKRADVVHCHQYRTAITSMTLAVSRIRRTPSFVTDHGGVSSRFQHLPLEGLVNAFLPVSEFSRQTLPGPAPVVLGGAVDSRFLEDHHEPKHRSVLFVGRLLPHKGIDYLIDAMDPRTRLDVMGRVCDEEYLHRLLRLASGKDVHFHTNADDQAIIRAYRRAAVTVLPSVYEDCAGRTYSAPELLGLVLIESMACGTPVICTRVGGMPEVVQDGRTGFIVEPNRTDALRDRIQLILGDSSRADAMGRAAREFVKSVCTWSTVARRCLDAYAGRYHPLPVQ